MDLFEVEADMSELTDVLVRLRRRGTRLRPVMEIVAEGLVADVNDKFEAEGPGWAPLAESTLAKRRKGGKGAKILQDTGRWAASNKPHAGEDFAEASTDVAYAVFHVSEGARSVIPLRNPYDLPDDAYERHVETIRDYVIGELGR